MRSVIMLDAIRAAQRMEAAYERAVCTATRPTILWTMAMALKRRLYPMR